MEGAVVILFAAIFIGLLVLNGVVANSKGRSVPLWVFLGFLFNPLALIILAFLPKVTGTTGTNA